ncbi:hypothetical protein ASPSYDRAFT_757160 [Aspergillus sydowii CBS 593.65]|uniref:Uncharacterized protein n=1 Tax=Aspergillus sydowii CBS 593.65 TaxID=1036612 RepID=A0A1L9TMR6_9EURO|nr:uncharacterized protein ASPSYDRAFT_757160 [Aspergillus sydowii CBS 593.65]OJJ60707.1 hypothetical protein ASPSYDRAFT_757160 [Aspergillus sydowii CBS 593.65]
MSCTCCSYARSRPNESRFIHPLVAEWETGGSRERHRAAGRAAWGRGAGGGTRAARAARTEEAGQPVPAGEAALLVIAELALHEASGRGADTGSNTGTAAGSGPRWELSREASREASGEASRGPRREAGRAAGAGRWGRRQKATTLLRSRKSKGTADEAEGGDERVLHLERCV